MPLSKRYIDFLLDKDLSKTVGCAWCGRTFDTDNENEVFCSDGCRLTAVGARPCIYCGILATEKDHFVPKSFAVRIEDFAKARRRSLKVPSCSECNKTAGDRVFVTLREKRWYIAIQYEKRYRKVLYAPDWTDEEIIELGYTLQNSIKINQALKEHILYRMSRLLR